MTANQEHKLGTRAAVLIIVTLCGLSVLASLIGCLTAAKIGEWQRAGNGNCHETIGYNDEFPTIPRTLPSHRLCMHDLGNVRATADRAEPVQAPRDQTTGGVSTAGEHDGE